MQSDVNIRINRLGPIKGPVAIRLKPFMIFSGPSGVGKSYLSLLVHYVYRIFSGEALKEILEEHGVAYEKLRDEMPEETTLLYRISAVQLTSWINDNAAEYLRNMLGDPNLETDFNIEFPGLPENFSFVFRRSTLSLGSGDIIEHVETLNMLEMDTPINLPPNGATWKQIPFRFLLSLFLRRQYNIGITQAFLMPPSRGSLIALPESVRATMHGMYREFIDDMSTLKGMLPATYTPSSGRPNKEMEDKVKSILHKSILHGDIYIVDDEIVYNIDADDKSMPITAAASLRLTGSYDTLTPGIPVVDLFTI